MAEYLNKIQLTNDDDDDDDDEKDTCNMCGGSGYLDLEQEQVCPNCNGSGQA